MENPTFVYVTHINTTPEKLWEALTQAEFTRQYWGGLQIQSDWTVGAPVSFIKPGGVADIKARGFFRAPDCQNIAGSFGR